MGGILAETRDRNAIVRRYAPVLVALQDLRNAIVHYPYRGDVPIATPRPDTVDRLRRVHRELLHPVQIGQCLRMPAVISAAPEEPLRDALQQMAEHAFSQLPVYTEGRYLGLLTTNAVARWLAAQISDTGEVVVEKVLVREVLDYVEPTERVVHLARTVSVAAVIEMFRKEDRAGPLVAVIVSERGLPTQKPLGVVVRDDLSCLLERLPAEGV
ncbi:CBS domain-containing protein [Rhodococcus pyridinivorans]